MAEAPKALVIDEVLQGSIDAVKSTEERYRLAQEEAAISDSDRPVYFDPEIRALEQCRINRFYGIVISPSMESVFDCFHVGVHGSN